MNISVCKVDNRVQKKFGHGPKFQSFETKALFCLSVSLPLCLSVCLSVCQSACLSLYASQSPCQFISYRRTLQWHDGTVSFTDDIPFLGMDCFCMYGLYAFHLETRTNPCNLRSRLYYLCEFDISRDKHAFDKKSQALLPDRLIANMTEYPTGRVMCPEGHMTHSQFACEAQTFCFAGRRQVPVDLTGSPADASCPAPLKPLPPYFRCQGRLQVVAYTVVCDHRQDCADSSDEDFCVFPACRPGSDIMCDNGQVSYVLRVIQMVTCNHYKIVKVFVCCRCK